jgi:nitrogen fixation/metabolism regulation signal transduction histidine kinase
MSLRIRLLLGYGYLVLLIVLAAGGAAVGFFHLGGEIDRILTDNVESITQATHMLEALERQDSATLAALFEEGVAPDVQEDMQRSHQAFIEALDVAREHQTIEGEGELIDRLEHDYERYVELRAELVERPLARPLEAYEEQTFPIFAAVKQSVIDLLDLNREAMVQAEEDARQAAIQYGVWLGILVTIALLSLVFMSRSLRSLLISRLAYFKSVSEAIVHGDSQRRFQTRHNDELGVLAGHFNAALDTQERLRAEAQGQLNQQRQLLLGVLDQWNEPSAMFGFDGRLVATTADQEDVERFKQGRPWIQSEGRKLLADYEVGDDIPEGRLSLEDGKELRFRMLVARRVRAVGWLCTIE